MPPPPRTLTGGTFSTRAIDVTIRLGLLLLLLAWCFTLARPFLIPLVWGVILAIAFHPVFDALQRRLGGRQGLTATLMTILALVFLLGPTATLATILVDNAQALARELADGELTIEPPPAAVATWPLIGEPIFHLWELASQNLADALNEIGPQLQRVGTWLLGAAAGAALALLQFIIAIIVAGVLMPHAAGGRRLADALAGRLVGERGKGLVELAEGTVRNVARGVVGASFIQALLAGVVMAAAGVPGAGLLALIAFVLSVVQIGVLPVMLFAVIWVFSSAATLTGVVFLIAAIGVTLTDNILKPILMGRGSTIPILVIFIGVIGGLLAHGLIGLFVGPVVLALGYELIRAWIFPPAPTTAE
jgi:predicted PurR-regulated permease PerM